jgi:hypothetical protein
MKKGKNKNKRAIHKGGIRGKGKKMYKSK